MLESVLRRPNSNQSGGAGGIRTHEWRFCRPLPWATWVPRRNFKYSEILRECQGVARQATAEKCYFFATGVVPAIFASRKNRADSSGGVGLM
jgi:hypothetical protein